MRKNTDNLSSFAEIFAGLSIPGSERNLNDGDCLIIKPQHIYHNEVHLGNNSKYYCKKEFVAAKTAEKCFLKNGDILIRNTGKLSFAMYNGKDSNVIVNQNVVIIRANEESKEKLRNIFDSKSGIRRFGKELKSFNHQDIISQLSNLSISKISKKNFFDKVYDFFA